jgi:hypothetical protein
VKQARFRRNPYSTPREQGLGDVSRETCAFLSQALLKAVLADVSRETFARGRISGGRAE